MTPQDAFERVLQALSARAWSPETARAERIAPLLHRALGGSAYRRDFAACAARNVELLDGLDAIGTALGSAGVRPVVLKGGDLATRLYPSEALRPMSDLDLWVRIEDVEATESVLHGLGLVPFCPEMAPGLARRIRHARLFVRAGGALSVDLHWSLVGHASDRRAPSLDWFASRAVARTPRPWLGLDDTATPLYLAGHAKLQHWDERAPLLWLVDFYLACHRDVDWSALFGAAERFDWRSALAAMARETHRRLELALPEPLQQFVDASPKAGAAAPPPARGGPERALKELSDLDWKGRVALVASYVFPSREYLRFRYPSLASWKLYPARWTSLLGSVVSLAAKRFGAVRS